MSSSPSPRVVVVVVVVVVVAVASRRVVVVVVVVLRRRRWRHVWDAGSLSRLSMNTGTPARRDALTATTAALRCLALGLGNLVATLEEGAEDEDDDDDAAGLPRVFRRRFRRRPRRRFPGRLVDSGTPRFVSLSSSASRASQVAAATSTACICANIARDGSAISVRCFTRVSVRGEKSESETSTGRQAVGPTLSCTVQPCWEVGVGPAKQSESGRGTTTWEAALGTR